MNRRLKRWAVSEAFLSHCFLQNGMKYFIVSDVPQDARLHRIAFDLPQSLYWFIFEHESFDEVEIGAKIPDGGTIKLHTSPKDFPKEPGTQTEKPRMREFF